MQSGVCARIHGGLCGACAGGSAHVSTGGSEEPVGPARPPTPMGYVRHVWACGTCDTCGSCGAGGNCSTSAICGTRGTCVTCGSARTCGACKTCGACRTRGTCEASGTYWTSGTCATARRARCTRRAWLAWRARRPRARGAHRCRMAACAGCQGGGSQERQMSIFPRRSGRSDNDAAPPMGSDAGRGTPLASHHIRRPQHRPFTTVERKMFAPLRRELQNEWHDCSPAPPTLILRVVKSPRADRKKKIRSISVRASAFNIKVGGGGGSHHQLSRRPGGANLFLSTV